MDLRQIRLGLQACRLITMPIETIAPLVQVKVRLARTP